MMVNCQIITLSLASARGREGGKKERNLSVVENYRAWGIFWKNLNPSRPRVFVNFSGVGPLFIWSVSLVIGTYSIYCTFFFLERTRGRLNVTMVYISWYKLL